jgi:mannan endo-1,6-alpha-mannosidase
LALILLSLTNAVPFANPSAIFPSTAPSESKEAAAGSTPYAKAVVLATVFHHVTTGLGAYQHYKLETHNNNSMRIGVWGNVWLTLTGLVTLAVLQSYQGERKVEEVAKKVR